MIIVLQPRSDGHLVYIRKRYICVDRNLWTGQYRKNECLFGKAIYESINSQGFTEPFVYMPTDDPSIIAIYRVRVYVEGILEDKLVSSPQEQCSNPVPSDLSKTTSEDSRER